MKIKSITTSFPRDIKLGHFIHPNDENWDFAVITIELTDIGERCPLRTIKTSIEVDRHECSALVSMPDVIEQHKTVLYGRAMTRSTVTLEIIEMTGDGDDLHRWKAVAEVAGTWERKSFDNILGRLIALLAHPLPSA